MISEAGSFEQLVTLDARVDGVFIPASARISGMQDGIGYLSMVIVAYWGRRRGVGRQLMREVERVADERRLLLVTHCRPELVPFYEAAGFRVRGDTVRGVELHRPRYQGGE